jgi:hypothetical protein
VSQIPTPVAPAEPFVPDPRVAKLKELEATYPPPSEDEMMADWKWLHDRMAEGYFAVDGPYWGRWVAAYQRRIVGSDLDPLELELRTVQEFGVHPGRLAITYIGLV